MPPKGAKAAKTDDKKAKTDDKKKPVAAATPQKPKAKSPSSPEETSPKKPTPRKPKSEPKNETPKIFKTLTSEAGPGTATLPVDVGCDNDSFTAAPFSKGGYQKELKLGAPNGFTVAKTMMLKEGEYAGYQIILIKPAKPFNFTDLPEVAKTRVYRMYFANKGAISKEIMLDGKRARNKEIYAKTYSDAKPHRMALLAVNKEINGKARDIFHALTLQFDSTTHLLDFLCQVPASIRPRLRAINIRTYAKPTARNALHFLAEAPHLTHLHINSNITNESDPAKAAKTFHADAYKFLQAIGDAKNDKTAGVAILSFGKEAFTAKDDEKKPWGEEMVAQFREELRKKMI